LRFQVDESRKFAAIDEVKARLRGPMRQGHQRRRYDRGARDHRRRLVAAARLEHPGRAGRARRKQHSGGPRPLLAQIDAQLAASGLERGAQAAH
jgi:phosphomannomutase